MSFQSVVKSLEKEGLVLLSDGHLPCVVKLVGGPTVTGSWWGHKKGHKIFWSLRMLDAHPDALATRLVSGKVTYLHRRLWTGFLSVATARDPWQTSGLSRGARTLEAAVAREGEVRMDRYASGHSRAEARAAARELEWRLLLYTDEVHTEKGSHSKLLMTWSRCPKFRGFRFRPKDPSAARAELEKLLDRLNERFEGKGTLPWRQNYTPPPRTRQP